MRGDVVVIGSGPIGAVVASRFAEAGRAVPMLEAGPAISDPFVLVGGVDSASKSLLRALMMLANDGA